MDNRFEYEDGYGHEWELAEMLAEEAFDLYEKGQMQQAFDKLTLAIQKGPENAAWFFNMALTLDGMEHYEQAITCFEKALDLLVDDVEVLNCLGVDYTRTAQYDLALATFERIEQIDPLFEPAYCNRIIAYTEMEQHEKAEQMFYLAQQIHSDCPLCFYNIGNSLFSRGVYERAIWCWEKTASLDPNHPQIHFRLAQACWISGRGQQARQEFLKEIRKNPADLEVLLDFGIFLLESGDIESAKEKFNRILEFDPDSSVARFYLGEVYRLRGEGEIAVRYYREAIDADEHLAGPRYRLAEMLFFQGQTGQSLELLQGELKLEVQDVEVLVGMGVMFLQMKDLEGAAQCFLQSLDVQHEEPRAFLGLGMVLAMRGEYTAGRQCMEQALRLDNEDAVTLLNAAWLCCRAEDWEAAGMYAAIGQTICGNREPFQTTFRSIEKEIRMRHFPRPSPVFSQNG